MATRKEAIDRELAARRAAGSTPSAPGSAQKRVEAQRNVIASRGAATPGAVRTRAPIAPTAYARKDAKRKADELNATTGYKRTKPKKPRFGAGEQVNVGTAQRTMSRLRRLGANKPGGGYGADIYKGGITGAEARKVKRMVRNRRDSRTKYSI